MPAMNSPAALPLAALVHPDDEHAMELLLERVARRLQAAGWRVGGLVHRQDRYANGNKRMQLFDLRSDRQVELSQDLGCASRACSLNPQALAQASAVLREALDDGVDLVVINRFGIVEASGQGFAAEFAAFVEAGTPVLTAVAARHLEDWRRYTGGLHAELAADETLIEAWCRQHLSRTDTCTP
jgi:nucleoside-triphosphatase THEP1